jgi:putative DNA primase/helicase
MVDGQNRVVHWRGGWMLHGRGCYRSVSKIEVRSHIIKFLNDRYCSLSMPVTSNVMDQALAMSVINERIEPPAWLCRDDGDWPAGEIVSAANGLVSIRRLATGDDDYLREHTPRFFSETALAFNVHRDAPLPQRWLGFLNELWPDSGDSIESLQELCGYLVAGGTWLQKIFAFIGPPRSGKGTLGRVLRALVGPDNCAGPALASFSSNFGLWGLLGKSLAIIPDARLSSRTDQAVVVERLLSISGEDALLVDRKNLEPISVTLPVRLLLVTNELPKLGDSSGALAKRLIVWRFIASFYGRENPKLTDELLAELPGIFNWAIAGWKRLHERGHIVQPRMGAEMVRDIEDLGSPVTAFVRDSCYLDPNAETPVSSIFQAWRGWCEDKGERVGTEQLFGRNLTAAIPSLARSQPRDELGNRYRAYIGIGLNSQVGGGF